MIKFAKISQITASATEAMVTENFFPNFLFENILPINRGRGMYIIERINLLRNTIGRVIRSDNTLRAHNNYLSLFIHSVLAFDAADECQKKIRNLPPALFCENFAI